MRYIFLLFAFYPFFLQSQNKYTISGKITDSETGEDMISAAVVETESGKGVISNSYGFYSLTLPEGKYLVKYSFIGYQNHEELIDLEENLVRNVELSALNLELDEVIVTAEKSDKNITHVLSGIENISLEEIKSIPVFFGENDILKTIQLLPGISNSSEGSTGFNVRGGSMGQNLILLDEAPVYSSSHLMGFFSVFNSDALNDVTVYKGSIPALYGGRASSVVDISMNNGNTKSFSSSGGIGLVSSRLTLEGPVIKDRMSFIVSGRRTYGDLLAKLFFPGDIITDDTNFYFYDLNAKVNLILNENNRVFFSAYTGKDIFELNNNIGTWWGNKTGTIRWNHLFHERLFSNTSLIYSKFDYGFIFGQNSLKLRSGIEDYTFEEDLSWYINPQNTLKTGFVLTHHSFLPGELKTSSDTIDYNTIRKEKQGYEAAVYIQNEQKITTGLSINYGIRISAFNQVGPATFYTYNEKNEISDSTSIKKGETIYPYYSIEPRLALNQKLTKHSSLKFSYNRLTQNLHLLSNTTAGSPTDVWIPSSKNIKPTLVDHFSVGYFHNFLNNNIESSIEIYYKNIGNTIDYEDGADILFDEHTESQLLAGKGRSAGIEFYLKKKSNRLTGWISYTLSRTENRIDGINDNKWYPVRYDKTHDLSIVNIYKISKRLSASAVWNYSTGNAVTFPSGKYYLNYLTVPLYTERNGYRMPAYHRLDLSLVLEGKERKKFNTSWDFSIYNVYNRYNAYIITFREANTIPGNTEAVKLSLFGIVPTINLNFSFK